MSPVIRVPMGREPTDMPTAAAPEKAIAKRSKPRVSGGLKDHQSRAFDM
jgi:hypothetical protein